LEYLMVKNIIMCPYWFHLGAIPLIEEAK